MVIFRNYETERFTYNPNNATYAFRFNVYTDTQISVTLQYRDCCGQVKEMNVPFTVSLIKKQVILQDTYDRGEVVLIHRETTYDTCILEELGQKLTQLKDQCACKEVTLCKIPDPTGFKEGDVLGIKNHLTGELTFFTPTFDSTKFPNGENHQRGEVIVHTPEGNILHKLMELPRVDGNTKEGDVIALVDTVNWKLAYETLNLLPDPTSQKNNLFVKNDGNNFTLVQLNIPFITQPTSSDEGEVMVLSSDSHSFVYVSKTMAPKITDNDKYEVFVGDNGTYELRVKPELPTPNGTTSYVLTDGNGGYTLQEIKGNTPPKVTLNDISLNDFVSTVSQPQTFTSSHVNILGDIIPNLLNNIIISQSDNIAILTQYKSGSWSTSPVLTNKPISFTNNGINSYLIIKKLTGASFGGKYILETTNSPDKRILAVGLELKNEASIHDQPMNALFDTVTPNLYPTGDIINTIGKVPSGITLTSMSSDDYDYRPILTDSPCTFTINVGNNVGEHSYVIFKNPSKASLQNYTFTLTTSQIATKNLDFYAGTITTTVVNGYKSLKYFTDTINTPVEITGDGSVTNLMNFLPNLHDNSTSFLDVTPNSFNRMPTLNDAPINSSITSTYGWMVLKTPQNHTLNGMSFVLKTSTIANKKLTMFAGNFRKGTPAVVYPTGYIVKDENNDVEVVDYTHEFDGGNWNIGLVSYFSYPLETLFAKYGSKIKYVITLYFKGIARYIKPSYSGVTLGQWEYPNNAIVNRGEVTNDLVYFQFEGSFDQLIGVSQITAGHIVFYIDNYIASPAQSEIIEHTLYLQNGTKAVVGLDNDNVVYADGSTEQLPLSLKYISFDKLTLNFNKNFTFANVGNFVNTFILDSITGEVSLDANGASCIGSPDDCVLMLYPSDFSGSFGGTTITIQNNNLTNIDVEIYTYTTVAKLLTTVHVVPNGTSTYTFANGITNIIFKSFNNYIIKSITKPIVVVNNNDQIALEIRGNSDYLVVGNNGTPSLDMIIEDGTLTTTSTQTSQTLFVVGDAKSVKGLRGTDLIYTDDTKKTLSDTNNIQFEIKGNTDFLVIGNADSTNGDADFPLKFEIKHPINTTGLVIKDYTMRLRYVSNPILEILNDKLNTVNGQSISMSDTSRLFLDVADNTNTIIIGNIESTTPTHFVLKKEVDTFITVDSNGTSYINSSIHGIPDISNSPDRYFLGTVLSSGKIELGLIPSPTDISEDYLLSNGISSSITFKISNGFLDNTAGFAMVNGKYISVKPQHISIRGNYIHLNEHGFMSTDSTSVVNGKLFLGIIYDNKFAIKAPIIDKLHQQVLTYSNLKTDVTLTYNETTRELISSGGILNVPDQNIIHIPSGVLPFDMVTSNNHVDTFTSFPLNPKLETSSGLTNLDNLKGVYNVYINNKGHLYIPYPRGIDEEVGKLRQDIWMGAIVVENNVAKFVKYIQPRRVLNTLIGRDSNLIVGNDNNSFKASDLTLSYINDRVHNLENFIKIQLLLTKRYVQGWSKNIFFDIVNAGIYVSPTHFQQNPVVNHVRLPDIFNVMYKVDDVTTVPILQSHIAKDHTPLVAYFGIYTLVENVLVNVTNSKWTSAPKILSTIYDSNLDDSDTIGTNNLTENPIIFKFNKSVTENVTIESIMGSINDNYILNTTFKNYLILSFNTSDRYPDITGHVYTINTSNFKNCTISFYGSLSLTGDLQPITVDWNVSGIKHTSDSIIITNNVPINLTILNNLKRIMILIGSVDYSNTFDYKSSGTMVESITSSMNFIGEFDFDTTTSVPVYKTINLGTLSSFNSNTQPHFLGKLGNIVSGHKLAFYIFVNNIPTQYTNGITFNTIKDNAYIPTLYLENSTVNVKLYAKLVYKHDVGCLEYMLDHTLTQDELDNYNVIILWKLNDPLDVINANVQVLVRVIS